MATKDENVEIFCEFLEVIINQVLFLRDVYPKNIFTDRKRFGIPVKMSSQPWLNNYVTDTLHNLSTVLQNNGADIESVVIVVAEQTRPVEKYVVEIEKCSFKKSLRDGFHALLETTFVSFILKLTQAVGELPRAPADDTGWWVELGTNQGGALRLTSSLDWCLSSASSTTTSAAILPVMTVTSPTRLQIYIEKMS